MNTWVTYEKCEGSSSGKARDCKPRNAGSIPAPSSTYWRFMRIFALALHLFLVAAMTVIAFDEVEDEDYYYATFTFLLAILNSLGAALDVLSLIEKAVK